MVNELGTLEEFGESEHQREPEYSTGVGSYVDPRDLAGVPGDNPAYQNHREVLGGATPAPQPSL